MFLKSQTASNSKPQCPLARPTLPRPQLTCLAAAVEASVVTITAPTVPVCSPHPDAVKRRKQQEEWRRRRSAEREDEQQLAAMNLKWYEGPQPANMSMCNSPEEYKKLLAKADKEGKLLVAKFFTGDCWVCKSLHPKIKQIALENPDVMWAKLNGSDPALQKMFHDLGITKVPMFHMVRDGQLVSELTASLSPEKLAVFRAELAAHKPTAQPAHS